jgi:hypothetical protein
MPSSVGISLYRWTVGPLLILIVAVVALAAVVT